MRILLVSDTHLAPATERFEGNWDAARRFAAAADVDVTVHLGDISLDGARVPSDLEYAERAARDWPTPIRFLPGNHDIGDNPWAPGLSNDHPLDLDRLADYRARFGPDYWTIDADGAWILGIDAQLFGSETREEEAQWSWLADRVHEAAKRPVAIMLHKPLFLDDPEDPRPHIRYVPLRERRRLLSMMSSMDVRAVLSGHTHQYLDRAVARVRHVWVPSTAYVFPDASQERIGEKWNALGILHLDAAECRFDLVFADGMTQNVWRGVGDGAD